MKIKKYLIKILAQTKQWILSVVIKRLFLCKIGIHKYEYTGMNGLCEEYKCYKCGKIYNISLY